MFPSIRTFNFDLIMDFWAEMSYLVLRPGSKIAFKSTHEAQQLLCHMFYSNLSFDFDIVLC